MKKSTKGSEMAEQGKVKEVPESCTLLAGMCTVLKMSKEGRDFAAAFQRIRMEVCEVTCTALGLRSDPVPVAGNASK